MSSPKRRTQAPRTAKLTLPTIPFLVYRFVANPMRGYMAKPVTNAALLEEKRVARTRGVTAHD
jgi:hypothetical protein